MSGFEESYRRSLESTSDGQISMSCVWKKADELYLGEWVLYLPIEITEGLNIAPKVALVQQIRLVAGRYEIRTSKGVMFITDREMIQALV